MQRIIKVSIIFTAIIVVLIFARGPDGFICRFIYPSAYTDFERGLWGTLAGCDCLQSTTSSSANVEPRDTEGIQVGDSLARVIEVLGEGVWRSYTKSDFWWLEFDDHDVRPLFLRDRTKPKYPLALAQPDTVIGFK